MCCPTGAIPTIAIADSGVKMTAWPSALVTSGQNSCARRVVEVEIEVHEAAGPEYEEPRADEQAGIGLWQAVPERREHHRAGHEID